MDLADIADGLEAGSPPALAELLSLNQAVMRRVREKERDLKETLVREASDLARDGLMAEAAHRLRLYTNPKFYDIGECKAKYAAAMRAKREARQ